MAATQAFALANYSTKNAIALARLKTEFKGKVELLQLPTAALRELKKLSSEVIREQSEKTPQAKKVNASFAKFQALVGPWDHVVAENEHGRIGRCHQFDLSKHGLESGARTDDLRMSALL